MGNIGGSLTWHATPARAVNFVEFYVDGALTQTDTTSPYTYNRRLHKFIRLDNACRVGSYPRLRALSIDNRTYAFYGATVTIANQPQNTALPVIAGLPAQGQTLTASTGSWTNSPSSYSYRWNRCNASGADWQLFQAPSPAATPSWPLT